MHQIRAHLAHLGHPVAGDSVYGDAGSDFHRLFLHADRLAFPHPLRRETVRCRAPLPDDLRLELCVLASSNRVTVPASSTAPSGVRMDAP
jgi:hypothetical protein